MAREREMELAEYIKAMTPERIRKLVVENGRMTMEREALKKTIAAISADNVAMTKQLGQTQSRCTELLEENRKLKGVGK